MILSLLFTNTTLVVSAVSIVTSILGALGISTYFSTKGKYKAEKEIRLDKEREEAYKQLQHDNQLREIAKILDEKISPVKSSLEALTAQSVEMTKGTVVLLRDRMKCSLQYCKKQGYCDSTDLANWMEMYEEYKALGGNHFKQYIDAWKEELENLPREKVKAARKKSN